ncbi:MAG: hypothetical protein WAK18_14235 [Nocardioidaceae bacterium]
MTTKSPLLTSLDALHAGYVDRINRAVAVDHLQDADALAAAYDEDATRLVAEHDGLTHLLPLQRQIPAMRLRRIERLRWLARFDPFLNKRGDRHHD